MMSKLLHDQNRNSRLVTHPPLVDRILALKKGVPDDLDHTIAMGRSPRIDHDEILYW